MEVKSSFLFFEIRPSAPVRGTRLALPSIHGYSSRGPSMPGASAATAEENI